MCAKVEDQYMADLPSIRLNPSPPFQHTACDLFGPFNVRIKRMTTMKVWGVIFTCLATRAVYCDIALDYSAQEFIQTFRRFLSVRGKPESMLSDNGSQLVAAQKEIRFWCANREISWQFITPLAPHQNGCAEALVKSVKMNLKIVIGEKVPAPF
ncbi:uncharacterized protein LOC141904311 [Tubulanus polymorphus]|uniref:uncharacterized protein LOC141904311 n=1 Tax=Tubulanus polymorphus TaxID=672921 RepID=UPI003DA512F5